MRLQDTNTVVGSGQMIIMEEQKGPKSHDPTSTTYETLSCFPSFYDTVKPCFKVLRVQFLWMLLRTSLLLSADNKLWTAYLQFRATVVIKFDHFQWHSV